MKMPNQTITLDIDGLDGPLGQRVYTALRYKILNLTLHPGMILRKGVLCEQLGVSRSPVAEALGRLSSEGLVDIIPQSATRVAQFSLMELREESFLREAVEVAAVAKVSNERSDDQLTKLSRNLRLQALLIEDGDMQGFFEADVDFHELILEFTGFPKVALAAGQMSLQLRRARVLLLPEEGRLGEALIEHQAIFDAIKSKDVAAATDAMSLHLRQLIKRIVPLEQHHSGYFRAS
jgi:DNA-binding GntR family transcriptional regulator